ncbi:MAG: HAMP domain-containing histidine kinase [Spirochaetaceae bacterium]|jgi:signal transduction histidine kinase|nr:HAMP domain-containing histidine kinase [Spirochaetaceae bacterium]
MISLQNRLACTYSIFLCVLLAGLAVIANIVTKNFFQELVKKSIESKNQEIVRAVRDLYNPWEKQFTLSALEAVGMLFMHEGFIIDLENPSGEKIWDARDMDMEHCVLALQKINERMRSSHGILSEIQNLDFPLYFGAEMIGTVYIASVGPFFYTEAQSEFIARFNKLLGASALVFIIVSVSISAGLAGALARPIKAASDAAHSIAEHYRKGNAPKAFNIALEERYSTVELSELSRSINKLGRELAEAERRQKQLTSDIAHELRTPLTSLQGAIEAFIDGVWTATPERLNALLYEVKRLVKLTEDLRTLTALEWETIVLHKTYFDIAELLETAVSQFEKLSREKGVALIPRLESARIYADYDRIKQVVINLLSNAVHYTDSGTITISVEKEFGKILIKIADTGFGISSADLPHIFERFYRTDKSRSRNTGGSGIGLAIVSAVIAAHNWEISAESKAGKGSVFTITASSP